MRHRKKGVKLSRHSAERRALFRNLLTALLRHGRIVTTLPKAKALRHYAERAITLAKRSQAVPAESRTVANLSARRRLRRWVTDRAVLAKVFEEYAPLYAERAGGYTRILHFDRRSGDAAPRVIMELVEERRTRGAAKTEAGAAADKGKGATQLNVAPASEREGIVPTRGKRAKNTDEAP